MTDPMLKVLEMRVIRLEQQLETLARAIKLLADNDSEIMRRLPPVTEPEPATDDADREWDLFQRYQR